MNVCFYTYKHFRSAYVNGWYLVSSVVVFRCQYTSIPKCEQPFSIHFYFFPSCLAALT